MRWWFEFIGSPIRFLSTESLFLYKSVFFKTKNNIFIQSTIVESHMAIPHLYYVNIVPGLFTWVSPNLFC